MKLECQGAKIYIFFIEEITTQFVDATGCFQLEFPILKLGGWLKGVVMHLCLKCQSSGMNIRVLSSSLSFKSGWLSFWRTLELPNRVA